MFYISKKFYKYLFRIIKKKIIDKKQSILIDNNLNEFDCSIYNNVFKNKNSNIKPINNLSTSQDDWSLMYTSGTTGKPKGVVRNHNGYYLLASITAVELSISKKDNALNSYAIVSC